MRVVCWGKRIGGASLALAVLASGYPASAESLKDALAAAYLANPQLKAQQSALRATDEEAARARSGFRPQVSAKAEYSAQDVRIKPGASVGGSGAFDPALLGRWQVVSGKLFGHRHPARVSRVSHDQRGARRGRRDRGRARDSCVRWSSRFC